MKYSKEEVLQYIYEEDVKFIRLVFCDVFGKQKNISLMPDELARTFEYGKTIDASAIAGFGDEVYSDLVLHPEPETLMLLPWRPEHGKVVRMFASITYPDGIPFECDTRWILKQAIHDAKKAGYTFTFGSEQEFYLFELDEAGNPTKTPYDTAGYMDIAPEDRGENIRREICLTLEQMGIPPESSHHEAGPGQNSIDFRYSNPLTAADNTVTFQNIVKIAARRNGVDVDFGPKPLADKPGNGFHINMSLSSLDEPLAFAAAAGVLERVEEITAFLNPTEHSYERFGSLKAPGYISWGLENRSQLIRIPATTGQFQRFELRSPDPSANPYLAFALLIYAGLEGVERNLTLPETNNINLYKAPAKELEPLRKLPETRIQACQLALNSTFVKKYIPAAILDAYCN